MYFLNPRKVAEKTSQYRKWFAVLLLPLILSVACITGCRREKRDAPDRTSREELILGFSQIGAESAWRT